jgi:hypothetical protein
MTKIEEIQKYIDSFEDPDDAIFDLQLIVAMRDSEFEVGKLERTILEIYKDLVNSRDILNDWEYPESSADFTVYDLAQHLSWY